MSHLGSLHSREVVGVSTLEAHANPALVGFFQVDLSDGSRELISPSEALAYLEKGLLTPDFFEAAKPEASPELGSPEAAPADAAPEAPKAPRVRKAKPAPKAAKE